MNAIMRCIVSILFITILVAAPPSVDPPSELSIQGLLTSKGGQVGPDGNDGMTFKHFATQEGGKALFTDISPVKMDALHSVLGRRAISTPVSLIQTVLLGLKSKSIMNRNYPGSR